jgi:uncharacterized membrane protein YbaN (DUF454 family)
MSKAVFIPRQIWVAFGFVFVGLGILGLILPMMPGLVFFLIATFCFARGSRKFLRLLVTNKHVGPLIYDWKHARGMTVKTKFVAIFVASSSMLYSAFFLVHLLWVKICILLCLVVAVTMILITKTKKEINHS